MDFGCYRFLCLVVSNFRENKIISDTRKRSLTGLDIIFDTRKYRINLSIKYHLYPKSTKIDAFEQKIYAYVMSLVMTTVVTSAYMYFVRICRLLLTLNTNDTLCLVYYTNFCKKKKLYIYILTVYVYILGSPNAIVSRLQVFFLAKI